MSLHSLLGRVLAPTALIALSTVGAALPAQADPAEPALELFVPDRVVTVDGPGKTVAFDVVNTGAAAAKGFSVEFGSTTSPLPASIGFTPPAGCSPTSCAIDELAADSRKTFSFTVKPTAGLPALGESFVISLRNPGGELSETTTVTVLRAEKGIDLEVAEVADIDLAPGESKPVPVAVRNAGNQTADGVAVTLAGHKYVNFPNEYSNCEDAADQHGVTCLFDIKLAPGDVLTVSPETPLRVKAAADAPGPQSYDLGLGASAPGALDEAEDLAKKAAKEPKNQLKLVPMSQARAVEDLNQWDNNTSFSAKVSKNPADLVAIGGTFTGPAGATRTIKVGIRNDGPAATLDPTKQWAPTADVTIPSGLALTKVDQNCFPLADGEPLPDKSGQVSGHFYRCLVAGNLGKGAQALFSFTAKIENGQNEDPGSIKVNGGVQDSKTSNNVTAIKVTLTSGGGSGSGGGGGGLPVTGAPAGLIAAAGALLVAAGTMALVLTRRRRSGPATD